MRPNRPLTASSGQDRVPLIADAILAATATITHPGILRARVADFLQIAFDEPVMIAIWAGGVRVFRSLPDWQWRGTLAKRAWPSEDPVDGSFSVDGGVRIEARSLVDGAGVAELVRQVFLEANRQDSQLSQACASLLGQADKVHSVEVLQPQGTSVSDDDRKTILTSFKRRWETAQTLSRLLPSPLLRSPAFTDRVVPVLFSAIRFLPSDSFCRVSPGGGTHDYSAQILAPEGVEAPAGGAENDEFIADASFETGGLTLVRLGDRMAGAATLPGRTPEVDLCKRLLPDAGRVLISPVHVGGVPWICLYAPIAAGDAEFKRTYLFYRDIQPILAAQARDAALRGCRDAMIQFFREGLKLGDSEGALRNINLGWRKLSLIFPFQTCELQRTEERTDGSGTDSLRLGTTHLRLRSLGYPASFVPRTEFDALDLGKVLRELVREVADQEKIEVDLKRSLLETYDEVLHSGLNTLRASGTDLLREDFSIGEPPRQLRYRLVSEWGGSPPGDSSFDLGAEALLLKAITQAWLGEKATASALTLGRLLAHQHLLDSMKAGKAYSLDAVVARSSALLDGFHSAMSSRPDLHYRVVFSQDLLSRCVLPKEYLRRDLLEVVVYELLLNAYRHAALADPIEVDVFDEGDGSGLIVRSKVEKGQSWSTVYGIALPEHKAAAATKRSSFLLRFYDIEQITNRGLAVRSRVLGGEDRSGYDVYETKLYLGQFTTESGLPVRPSVKAN